MLPSEVLTLASSVVPAAIMVGGLVWHSGRNRANAEKSSQQHLDALERLTEEMQQLNRQIAEVTREAAVHRERFSAIAETLKSHSRRHDGHDARFRELERRRWPRAEGG